MPGKRWEEQVEEFDSVDEVNMHDPLLKDTRECDEPDAYVSLTEMER
jgi:hypothetical protein